MGDGAHDLGSDQPAAGDAAHAVDLARQGREFRWCVLLVVGGDQCLADLDDRVYEVRIDLICVSADNDVPRPVCDTGWCVEESGCLYAQIPHQS